ncbi:MAG: hypothetical protein LBC02_11980 [Planctomycetaceae bacterium]|nr:hypothetical protein [Planctomycetaceae bacterium]
MNNQRFRYVTPSVIHHNVLAGLKNFIITTSLNNIIIQSFLGISFTGRTTVTP